VHPIERETLDSALMSGHSVLEPIGRERLTARTQALRFGRHSVELLDAMAPHFADESRLIAISRQGRQQLEETWARERAENRSRRASGDWQSADRATDRAEAQAPVGPEVAATPGPRATHLGTPPGGTPQS